MEENGGVLVRGRRLVLAAAQDGGDGLVGASFWGLDECADEATSG
jgi:hypothetical protein